MLSSQIQHQEFEPREELQDVIKCFWYTRMDFGERPSRFEVVPDGYAEIIFYFGSTCSVSGNEGLRMLPSPFLVGLLGRPISFYARNRLEVIGVRCFPWTVFDLLGLPSGKESVRTFEHPIAGLQTTLETWVTAGNIEKAIVHVAQYFLSVWSGVATDSLLFDAGSAMREANGTLPVHRVAVAAHVTVRTLERKFKRYSGTTPAAFARKAKQGKLIISDDIVAFVQS